MASANRIVLFKGDDTGGILGRRCQITVNVAEGVTLDGCRGIWLFDGIAKEIPAPIVSGEMREVFYSHNETDKMRLGVRAGKFIIVDASGKIRTISNTIPVEVTDDVTRCYGSSSSATVNVGILVDWANIANKPALVNSVNGENGEVELTANDIPTTEADKSVQTKLDLLDDGFVALDRAVTSLGDAVADKASLSQDNELKGYNTFQQDAWFNGETVSIAGLLLLSNGWKALTQGGNALLGNEDFVAAVLASAYSKDEVDDKITRFVAHYLTAKDSATGRMIPFANHAALVYAKTHHTDENPQFFYAGEPFTPTKNDYCVVLADETVDNKTTRYSFVGEWGAGGSWQYQYTINDTAFSQAQWNAINSGITSTILASLARSADVAPKVHTHTADDITNLAAFVDARLPYALNTTSMIIDRAINITSEANITIPDGFTDLIVRATVTNSLSVTMPSGFVKFGDSFPAESGEWLVTITKIAAGEAYVKAIKLEVAE